MAKEPENTFAESLELQITEKETQGSFLYCMIADWNLCSDFTTLQNTL